jgi:queuine tRNA-ribosyltransferase
MTDSGGFQIFSLGAAFDGRESKFFNGHRVSIKNTDDKGEKKSLVRVDEDGVSFTSPLDGSKHRFTPEKSIEIQHKLGADIIFAFDECASPSAPYEYQKKAMERTHRWAIRSLETHQKASKVLWPSLAQRDGASRAIRQQANMRVRPQELCELFGIIQGGRHEDLRKESARVISKMLVRRSSGEGGDFDGFGIGGSFDKEDVGKSVKLVNEILPEEKPRHLLGIGGVEDLFSAVENGCDSFDCVAPTREARTGSLYTSRGRINITNARFRNDFTPLDKNCECCTCKNFTRAYLSHLFRSKELLAYTLASIHNLHFFISLVKDMRASIIDGKFEKYKKDFLYNFNT